MTGGLGFSARVVPENVTCWGRFDIRSRGTERGAGRDGSAESLTAAGHKPPLYRTGSVGGVVDSGQSVQRLSGESDRLDWRIPGCTGGHGSALRQPRRKVGAPRPRLSCWYPPQPDTRFWLGRSGCPAPRRLPGRHRGRNLPSADAVSFAEGRKADERQDEQDQHTAL